MLSRKSFKFLLLLLLAVLIGWWFGRKLDWAQVRVSLAQADWRLLIAATGLVIFTYLQRAFRWRTMLAPMTQTTLSELFTATVVGFGAILLIGRAGEAVRPVVLSLRNPRIKAGTSFMTIVVERLFDLIASFICFALCLFWVSAPPGHEAAFQRLNQTGALLMVASVIGLVALVIFQRRSAAIIAWCESHLAKWAFMPALVSRLVLGSLRHLAQALSIFVDRREMLKVTLWTVFLWSVIVVYDWLVLKAFGLPFGLAEATFIMSWSLVGSLVPTPGGAAGAFHAAAAAGILFLGHPGVTPEKAAAAALMIHLTGFGPALPIALFYLVRGDINLTRLREKVAEEEEHLSEDLTEFETAPATK